MSAGRFETEVRLADGKDYTLVFSFRTIRALNRRYDKSLAEMFFGGKLQEDQVFVAMLLALQEKHAGMTEDKLADLWDPSDMEKVYTLAVIEGLMIASGKSEEVRDIALAGLRDEIVKYERKIKDLQEPKDPTSAAASPSNDSETPKRIAMTSIGTS